MEQGDTVTVTVEFEEDTIRRIDSVASTDDPPGREAAIRHLLDVWFRTRQR